MKHVSRRDFLRLSAGAVGAGLLASCAPVPSGSQAPAGQAPAAAAPTKAAEAPAPTTAPKDKGTYTGKFVIMSAAGDTTRLKPFLDALNAEFPGVTFDFRGLTSEKYTELFTAAEVAGDQIDYMDLNGQDLRRYAVGGKVKDLSDLAWPKERMRPIGLATYTIQGKLWAVPAGGISGFPYLYNKKALDKIGAKEPVTYDDLLAMAPELQKAGYAPFVHAGKNIYLWPIWQFWAYAQTTGNKALEGTFKTLSGQGKFTDPEHVQALEFLYEYAQDKMFIEGVNSLDSDAAWIAFTQGKGAFWYEHSWRIGLFRDGAGKYPDLDLSLIPPTISVQDKNVKRQAPGGTGSAECIYAKIAPERLDLAGKVLDFWCSDKWVKWGNDLNKDPVSTNKNVQASDDPLALKYAKECADNQLTYLDWYWPPEITRAFQENQQALVTGGKKPPEAAAEIQKAMDQLYKDGYKFEA